MSDKSVRIAIDAMGGDHAPHITVEGTCMMSLESPAELILIGDEPVISAELKKHRHDPERIRIVHTPVAITMEDSPKVALKEKSNASVVLAAKLLSAGEADAMVSAGSTGAVVISAAMHIKRIAGVRRTAIAILYRTLNAQKRNDIFS
ncbi:MAG: phosphate acyltransferase PlsX, partial [Candidatus Marinimicrobia bacterium]|nr:phosphate acyltransferase PlsX [Candidatus Neomarinimicrobiota bacterium]